MPTASVFARKTILTALLLGVIVGCASQTDFVTVRNSSRNPFVSSLKTLPDVGSRQPSERTTQLLRRYNLEEAYRADTDAAATYIANAAQPENQHEHEFAIAELEYLAAKRVESKSPEQALGHYGTALLHAYKYLFDQQQGIACNPYDPQFRGACDLYNQSLEGLLRIARDSGELMPGQRRVIQTAEHTCSFDIELHSKGWHEKDIGDLRFVSDFQVVGLRNHYRSYGLGVPLIAIRKEGHADAPLETYYPSGLSFPLTAFLRIQNLPSQDGTNGPSDTNGHSDTKEPSDTNGQQGPRFVIELRDPIENDTFQVADQTLPLESDLSTPLAFYLNQPQLKGETLSTLGLLRPDSVRGLQGLYMLEPYDPQKMPVLMVHGLWSSPVTWMEMFNDLRSDRQISQRYQFWFYLYPTGQPFWVSATQMRQDLAQVRQTIDPQRRQAALDQMVLVGHSMGGLVSKMQSVESGDDFWRINSEQPFTELTAERELRTPLANAYFFRPNESIRRVVTIGTPHRGSPFANDLTEWLARKLINQPTVLTSKRGPLLAANPNYFRPDSALNIHTSIDSLDPDSPLLPALLNAKPAPWVEYHNIVGQLPDEGWQSFFREEGDGVVSLASARLDNAPQLASQEIVQADHLSVHRHPKSIYTVRQILLKQLQELEQLPYGDPSPEPIQLVERPAPVGEGQPARRPLIR